MHSGWNWWVDIMFQIVLLDATWPQVPATSLHLQEELAQCIPQMCGQGTLRKLNQKEDYIRRGMVQRIDKLKHSNL